MRKQNVETLVGIFVVIGLICIGYMTAKLGDVSIFGDDSYSLFARFSSVAGLKNGSSVQMVGIEVGKVENLLLDQERQQAMVELRIKNGVEIYDDAIASIKTSGLIGDKYVQIDPGGAGDLLGQDDNIYDTNSPLDIEDLIGKFAFGSIGGDEE
jgi:phospholipid/cholesterol/gamma-HCH transport system substrate-binding protein